jgi:SAM-dependent methyltransferase
MDDGELTVVTALADNRNPDSLAAKLRRKRFALFLRLLSSVDRPVTILDVGGTQNFWEEMGFSEVGDVSVTLLNLSEEATSLPNFTSAAGDAREMQFGDKSFDIVFSNSVIEHVGSKPDQLRMANEVQRVGKRYFVQTPNKYFPIEPHFVFPFFQFLPLASRVWLLRHFNLGWHKRTPDYASALRLVASVELLSRGVIRAMFPNAAIVEEKFGGFTKSFIAYGGWEIANP